MVPWKELPIRTVQLPKEALGYYIPITEQLTLQDGLGQTRWTMFGIKDTRKQVSRPADAHSVSSWMNGQGGSSPHIHIVKA